MKNLRTFPLLAATIGLLVVAISVSAGTLTVTSGPTYTPASAFTNTTFQVTVLHNPPPVAGDVVRVSGDATITPPASNNAAIDVAGNYSANGGDVISGAYSFTLDSAVTGSASYALKGSVTVFGSPQNFSTSGPILPGLHQYKGKFKAPANFPVATSGTFTGTLSFAFGPLPQSAISPSAISPNVGSGTLNVSFQQFDLQLAPAEAVPLLPSQPLNISTRLDVETGDNVLIGGFIITGSQQKKVIVRAIGPSLGSSVAGVLADPVLSLRRVDGSVLASNDNWIDSPNKQAIIDSGVPPKNDLESAIVATLDPGAYTAIVSGNNGGTGVGLVEAYDLNQAATSRLANISTRGLVQTADNVLIGGFILGPTSTGASSVVVRAIGPSLSASGVANPLQNPTLELRNGSGTLIASNDNWMDSPDKQVIIDNGLAPKNDNESALLAIPAPGNYTAIVRGVNNTTGVGLVELYHLQ